MDDIYNGYASRYTKIESILFIYFLDHFMWFNLWSVAFLFPSLKFLFNPNLTLLQLLSKLSTHFLCSKSIAFTQTWHLLSVRPSDPVFHIKWRFSIELVQNLNEIIKSTLVFAKSLTFDYNFIIVSSKSRINWISLYVCEIRWLKP